MLGQSPTHTASPTDEMLLPHSAHAEPSLLPVQKMSHEQWAAWLQEQLWGIINTLLATEGKRHVLLTSPRL